MNTPTTDHFPDAGKMTTQEDDVKALKDALAAVPSGWHDLNAARPHPEDEGVAEVGALDGDGAFSEVFAVDCGNYFAPEASLPLAKFYAEANPERLARLLARLEQAERGAERYRFIRAGGAYIEPNEGEVYMADDLGGKYYRDMRDFDMDIDSAIDRHRAAIASEKAS